MQTEGCFVKIIIQKVIIPWPKEIILKKLKINHFKLNFSIQQQQAKSHLDLWLIRIQNKKNIPKENFD